MKLYQKITLLFFITALFLTAIFFLSIRTTKTVDISSNTIKNHEEIKLIEEDNEEDLIKDENIAEYKSPLSGIECENYNRRPVAVMLSGDAITRPLSGLSQADMIFEMPVITGSVTRVMAVFVCENPWEIGSVRSARHDFIPLVAGIGAIFVHWGGSHFALDKLNNHIIDNLDALKDRFNVFYRKSDAPAAPHNGFTSINRILQAAEKTGYSAENNFGGYDFYTNEEVNLQRQEYKEKQICANSPEGCALTINYPMPFKVKYEYNYDSNFYLRERSGYAEMDKNTKSQIRAKNIVAMITKSTQIDDQYNTVEVEGEGKAFIFQNGRKIEGAWKKDKESIESKMVFLDNVGQELKLVPGQTWIEIIESPGELLTDFK